MNNVMKNLKGLPFGGASAVVDPDLDSEIDNIVLNHSVAKWLNDTNIHNQFLETYRGWILDGDQNTFRGFDRFPIAAMSNGTTEGFDKFYLKHHQRRFRCFRGEYMYHAAAWRNYFNNNWCRIEDDDIRENDAVVISLPFSDLGNQHPLMHQILTDCDRLGVPVLVDCAFFGICKDVNFDFDYDCITDITFSLSKTFPISHLRTGVRFTRADDDDTMLVHHKTAYVNRVAAGFGIALMNKYSADYNCKRWAPQQQDFCRQLGVEPSNTVIFGLGGDNYSEYNRGGDTNRLCFARYLHKGTLPND